MSTKLKTSLALLSLFLMAGTSAYAQSKTPDAASATPAAKTGTAAVAASNAGATPIAITATTSPLDLARAALAAQGGEKFRNMKSMVLIGTVDLYAPNSAQSVAGKFVIVTATGGRYRLEIESPVVKFRQIFDGEQSYSSIPNISTPNPLKFGLNLLTKFEQPGYTVSALPDKKKQRAFRISDTEGNITDFFIDPATGRVMVYTVPYQGNTFGVEHKSFKEVDGILVPINLTQRFETPQGAFFAEFKIKDAKVNQPVGDDVFAIPAQ